jgi:hypothetical protein
VATAVPNPAISAATPTNAVIRTRDLSLLSLFT